MRPIMGYFRALCASLTLAGALLLAGAAHADESDVAGRLTSYKGDVWYKVRGQPDVLVRAPQEVVAGSRIRTGYNGVAEILLRDESLLKLRPNSEIELSGLKRKRWKKTSILLYFGRLWSKVTRTLTGARASYEVRSPNSVAGVRGTEFEAISGEDGAARVIVREGSVDVNSGKSSINVGAGEQADSNGTNLKTGDAADDAAVEKWRRRSSRNLKRRGRSVVRASQSKTDLYKREIERLRERQKELQARAQVLSKGANTPEAQKELEDIKAELLDLSDQMAELGDAARVQFGWMDRVAELAADPRFRMIGRKQIQRDLKALLRVRETLDAMVREGTDVSIEAMDEMMDQMRDGKKTIKDKDGSTKDELFGDDPF